MSERDRVVFQIVAALLTPSMVLAQPAASACAAEGPLVTLRARLAVGAPSTAGSDSWVEVEVAGAQADATEVCESLVAQEARRVFPAATGLSTRVVSGCSEQPFPAAAGASGRAHLLVDRRAVDLAGGLTAGLMSECQLKRMERTRASVTAVSRFADRLHCEQARDRLLAARRRAAGEAQERSKAWLQDQLSQMEATEARACASVRLSTDLDVERAIVVELERVHAEEVRALAVLREKYLERHPRVVIARAKIDALRRQIDESQAKIDTMVAEDVKAAEQRASLRKAVDDRCRPAPRGKACRKAKADVLALDSEELAASTRRRDCELARGLVEQLRERTGRTDPLADEGPRPDCRPE